ncbi:hypothetical protein GCM10010357_69340 [Streptomyces luteireticuli]|uniref:Uncharacterized protein n=1 Tax=Streptomyces luteireticuli TaxID=173858 RepID=A0ABN0Z7Z8_9ACTN
MILTPRAVWACYGRGPAAQNLRGWTGAERTAKGFGQADQSDFQPWLRRVDACTDEAVGRGVGGRIAVNDDVMPVCRNYGCRGDVRAALTSHRLPGEQQAGTGLTVMPSERKVR